MLKSYEAIYKNNQLNWLSSTPNVNDVKVLVIVEENALDTEITNKSIRSLKGIVPKPENAVSLDDMKHAIALEATK